MGPLAPADRPVASDSGGCLVNKMSVATEKEELQHQVWLQLSGSFLLGHFGITYPCFSLAPKVKFRGKMSCRGMKRAQTVKENCRPYAR